MVEAHAAQGAGPILIRLSGFRHLRHHSQHLDRLREALGRQAFEEMLACPASILDRRLDEDRLRKVMNQYLRPGCHDILHAVVGVPEGRRPRTRLL